METTFDRKVNLNISQQADLLPEVPEGKTAAQAVLKPLLARLANLTVREAPVDLEALMARLSNENANAKEKNAKLYLGSVYSTILSRVQANGQISAQNMALLEEAAAIGKQVEGIEKQIAESTAKLAELKKKMSAQAATITELEIKTAMLEKQVELVKSQQLTPAEKRVAELKKKRLAEQDKQQQEVLDRKIAEAEQDVVAAQASLAKVQGDLAAAQGALATARGNLVAMQSQMAAATKGLAELKATKTELEGKIAACTDQLTDEEVARALVDALRNTVPHTNGLPDDAPERSEEEEAYLDKHNVVRILQDAVEKRDREMQDTIAVKREEKV